MIIWNRDRLHKNRVFGLNLVCQCTGTYRYVPVCTLIYEISKYIPVYTEYYVPELLVSHAFLTQNRGTYSVLKHHLMHVTHTHRIVSYSHLTQKSIFRNISLNMVHTSMYWYILSSYLYVQVDQHVLFRVKGALYS